MVDNELGQAVLIATLGAEPQIIPITVQLLLRQQTPLTQVVVLHTTADREPIQSALQHVQATFAQRPTWPVFTAMSLPCTDVLTQEELDLFSATFFTVVKEWIGRGYQVHLLLAGGRKSMSMIGMSIAQMLLGAEDRVWYLFSDEELRQSGRASITTDDDVRLIPIPLSVLAPAPARFGRPFGAETPAAARRQLIEVDQERRRYFVEQELTPAERAIAQHLAREVLTVDELAERLHKSPKTITNQLNIIYSKLENYFGLQPDKGVKREFLRRVLSPYFARGAFQPTDTRFGR